MFSSKTVYAMIVLAFSQANNNAAARFLRHEPSHRELSRAQDTSNSVNGPMSGNRLIAYGVRGLSGWLGALDDGLEAADCYLLGGGSENPEDPEDRKLDRDEDRDEDNDEIEDQNEDENDNDNEIEDENNEQEDEFEDEHEDRDEDRDEDSEDERDDEIEDENDEQEDEFEDEDEDERKLEFHHRDDPSHHHEIPLPNNDFSGDDIHVSWKSGSRSNDLFSVSSDSGSRDIHERDLSISHKQEYVVYVVNNNCGSSSVDDNSAAHAAVVLYEDSHSDESKTVIVDVDNGQCEYVGVTYKEHVDFDFKWRGVGSMDCSTMGSKNLCNLKSISPHACVIPMCISYTD